MRLVGTFVFSHFIDKMRKKGCKDDNLFQNVSMMKKLKKVLTVVRDFSVILCSTFCISTELGFQNKSKAEPERDS